MKSYGESVDLCEGGVLVSSFDAWDCRGGVVFIPLIRCTMICAAEWCQARAVVHFQAGQVVWLQNGLVLSLPLIAPFCFGWSCNWKKQFIFLVSLLEVPKSVAQVSLGAKKGISCGNEQHLPLSRNPGLRQEKAAKNPTRKEGAGRRPACSSRSLAWMGRVLRGQDVSSGVSTAWHES